MSFHATHCTAADWRSAADQALAKLSGVQGQLAFVYVGHAWTEQVDQLVQYLRSHSGIRHWVGSVGMGICSNGREEYDQASLAVMVTDLDAEQFHVIPNIDGDPAAFLDTTCGWRERNLAYFSVVHGDPMHNATPEIIENLASGLEGGFLVGGLSSSEGKQIQIADQALSGGVSGVLFSGQVPVATGLTQGCALIGHKHEITKCQRNIIIELDGRPALEAFKEDIGEVLARDLTKVGGYIFAALPIPGSDTGDYLVRNLVGLDPNQGLIAIGDMVQQGQIVQFAKRDAQTARADLEHMLDGLQHRLAAEGQTPKGALYHSCLGRGRHLFGENSEELRIISERLGSKLPLVGFYANGEISHHRLYGYTGVLTLFV